MILIMSSAYLSAEFQVELGPIPPTFLPLGNKKLLEHQVTALRAHYLDEEIVVSLPESFEVTETLQKKIDRLGVTLIPVPDRFSLSEAVLYTLNVSANEDGKPITILYGDTYISDYAFAIGFQDLITIAQAKNSYNWEYVETDGLDHPSFAKGRNLVWCGFFIFSDQRLLFKSLAIYRDSFNAAVKYYSQHRAVSYCETHHWQDLGHVNTYFAARANLTTQRAFNDLRIADGMVVKSGEPQQKIAAEAYWFETLPNHLRLFTSLYLGAKEIAGMTHYALEYLPCMPLNELFVHGENQPQDWRVIFEGIQKWFALALDPEIEAVDMIESSFQTLIHEKTFSRLEAYAAQVDLSLDAPTYYEGAELPAIRAIALECIEHIAQLAPIPGVLHGDLCFSNMLFDSRSLRLKVIDPRGLDPHHNLTIYGDLKYDYAKLTHSVIGLYDFIISGDYMIHNPQTPEVSLQFDIDDKAREIQKIFTEYRFLDQVTSLEIIPLVILLFLSMLPLHSDRPDRQEAMLLNGLRLYALWFKSKS